MGAGKNKSHRKHRISKHVLQAQERRRREGGAPGGPKSDNGTGQSGTLVANASASAEASSSPPTKTRQKQKTKDPNEAASYLSSWKHNASNPGIWKFNKNTQSWLLRHMYDASYIKKSTFELLAEYLGGLKGGERDRTREDAKRRALRYKDWEKKASKKPDGVSSDDVKKDRDNAMSVAKKTSGGGAVVDAEGGTDDRRWAALNDHEKRREYKRARKVVDVLKGEPLRLAVAEGN